MRGFSFTHLATLSIVSESTAVAYVTCSRVCLRGGEGKGWKGKREKEEEGKDEREGNKSTAD